MIMLIPKAPVSIYGAQYSKGLQLALKRCMFYLRPPKGSCKVLGVGDVHGLAFRVWGFEFGVLAQNYARFLGSKV